LLWGARLGALLLISQAVDCGLENTSAATAVNRLNRMLAAEREFTYQGMKEVEFGTRTSFLFVSHYADGSTAVETVGLPTTRRNKSWVQRHRRFYWLKDKELLLKNYHVREAGRETALGREAIALVIRSNHPGRPRMRLVVDEDTGLLLDVEKFDGSDRRTFRSRFTTLLLDPELPEPPAPKKPGFPWRHRGPPGPSKATALDFDPLMPRFLPEGFEEKSSYSSKRGFGRSRERPSLVTIYSDGMTWIKLRQRKAEEGSEECVVRQRPLHGSRVKMTVVVKGVEVRLEGDLNPSELIAVLESLGLEPEG
jgi:hypothetical protein